MLVSRDDFALRQGGLASQHVAQARLEGPEIEVRSHPDGFDRQPVGLFPHGQGLGSSHGAHEDGVDVAFREAFRPGDSPGVEGRHPPSEALQQGEDGGFLLRVDVGRHLLQDRIVPVGGAYDGGLSGTVPRLHRTPQLQQLQPNEAADLPVERGRREDDVVKIGGGLLGHHLHIVAGSTASLRHAWDAHRMSLVVHLASRRQQPFGKEGAPLAANRGDVDGRHVWGPFGHGRSSSRPFPLPDNPAAVRHSAWLNRSHHLGWLTTVTS